MDRQEQRRRLWYWQNACQCGLLTWEQVQEELDLLILELGEDTPGVFIDLAWEGSRGKNSLLHALREGLWSLGKDWRSPIPREIYQDLRRAVRERWEAGAWTMEETLDHLYLLAQLLDRPGDGDVLRLCDFYELAVEGEYGSVEQVAEQFVELLHREEEE